MIKILTAIIALLLLTACSSYDVVLETDTIEYDQDKIDICQYISKINDVEVRDFNRMANKIEEGEYHVSCPTVNIKKLGKQEVTVSINSVDISINFEVVDTTPPKIQISDTLEVEENNEYFDLKKLVSITDAYDRDPFIGYAGDYDLATPGEYTVKISAKDINNNESSLDVSVSVTEKEVEVVEKEVYIDPGGGGISPAPSTQPNESNGSSDNTTQPVISSLPPNTWLFSDGYDLITGFKACQDYRGGNAGSCSPLGSENDPYGYQYNP